MHMRYKHARFRLLPRAQDGDLSTSWTCFASTQEHELPEYLPFFACTITFDLFSFRHIKEVKIGEDVKVFGACVSILCTLLCRLSVFSHAPCGTFSFFPTGFLLTRSRLASSSFRKTASASAM